MLTEMQVSGARRILCQTLIKHSTAHPKQTEYDNGLLRLIRVVRRIILEVKLQLEILNLQLWLMLIVTGGSRTPYFLLLLIHELKKISNSLTSKIILQTLKFASTDCRHIRLAFGALCF